MDLNCILVLQKINTILEAMTMQNGIRHTQIHLLVETNSSLRKIGEKKYYPVYLKQIFILQE